MVSIWTDVYIVQSSGYKYLNPPQCVSKKFTYRNRFDYENKNAWDKQGKVEIDNEYNGEKIEDSNYSVVIWNQDNNGMFIDKAKTRRTNNNGNIF